MRTFKEYESFDGLQLAHLVKHKIISPEELLQAAIETVEEKNPELNAVICKMYDEARATIQKDLPPGLFQGVPFLLKDLLTEYAGAPLTFGSRYTKNFIPALDNEFVLRLKRAGLVIFGKTNTPEFGLSITTEPKLWGPTKNPWNKNRSAGGSSGGSAAAVASRMVPMAHGGDSGGSIRIPASYCGIFGFKPSRGRTPTGPDYMRVWQGLGVEHVLTRSVRDSAAMMDVLAGVELGSPFILSKPEQPFLTQLEKKSSSLRIAVMEEPFFETRKISKEYTKAFREAAQLCQDLGHHVEGAIFKMNADEVIWAFMIVMIGETMAGIKALNRLMGKKPKRDELEYRTLAMCHASKCFTAVDFAVAMQVIDKTTRQLAEFFQSYDVMMTPTMPMSPPPIGTFDLKWQEEYSLKWINLLPIGPWLRRFAFDVVKKFFMLNPFTPLFNIGGNPAMSVPLYWDSKGLPIGIQFAAAFKQDIQLLQLAKQLEEARPWAAKIPS